MIDVWFSLQHLCFSGCLSTAAKQNRHNLTEPHGGTWRERERRGLQNLRVVSGGFPAAIETTNCASVPIGVLVLGSVVEDLTKKLIKTSFLLLAAAV